MELIFLGTNAGVPSKDRNVTSMVLDLQNKQKSMWMFDCGEATQHQILHTRVKLPRLNKIFITHLHGDHIFGLPGLLCSRSMGGTETRLTVYGPKGIKAFIETALTLSQSYLTYPLDIMEIEDAGFLFDEEGIKVSCEALSHPVPCFGYRLEEKNSPGKLDAQKLKAENIPTGPWLQDLKQGKTITLPDGRAIDGKAYIGPEIKGRCIAIFGDTQPTPNALNLANNADVIVHEATFKHEMAEQANSRGHSTTVQAATLAKNANVKKLILTHISSRYLPEDYVELLKESQHVFSHTEIASDFAIFRL
ncbi:MULTISPECIES: ribonuclease Z [Proteus]|jgi:ribonuclease Z|uniref:Ribonuclease BN n=1 Tax=Proteus vulgaris TaxID=585 RepID=A0A379F685_PROVU|nr:MULTISPECIES: ribonuclease Z [Proteus]NBN59817.1 ribonuclease Z [Proteus sp. G2639]RNT26261.1 ribonuclease Z [Proteus mirabilis]AYY79685.1 ribonuclease Z [Proteus vulgaris]KGA56520.1 ribonuclease Z [Proteus vulgaris]MBG5984482.1 ribonuclease Z [Proteus vulgaris]